MLTIVGLSHAEDVANRATRGVADDDKPAAKQAEAQNSAFTVLLARVLDLNRQSSEDGSGVFKIQAPFGERLLALGWIVGDTHLVSVSTETKCRNCVSLRGTPRWFCEI